MALSWIKKYEPEKISDIEGQEEALKEIDRFISGFSKQKKRAKTGFLTVRKCLSVVSMNPANGVAYISHSHGPIHPRDIKDLLFLQFQ